MREIPFYIFVLLLALIGLAYYVGLKTDATAVGGIVNQWGQTFSGRNSNNQFAAYPKAA